MAEEKETPSNSVHSRAVNTIMVDHDNPDNTTIFSDKAHQIVKLLNGLSISQIKSVMNNVIEIVEEHLPIVVQNDVSKELLGFSDPSRGRGYCIEGQVQQGPIYGSKLIDALPPEESTKKENSNIKLECLKMAMEISFNDVDKALTILEKLLSGIGLN